MTWHDMAGQAWQDPARRDTTGHRTAGTARLGEARHVAARQDTAWQARRSIMIDGLEKRICEGTALLAQLRADIDAEIYQYEQRLARLKERRDSLIKQIQAAMNPEANA
jgi:putative intracellular protease/amidase